MDLSAYDLQILDNIFTKEEVLNTLDQLLGDKAPRSEGFTFNFYKSCWATIKADVMAVFHCFHNLRSMNLHPLNISNIVLVPKRMAQTGCKTSGQSTPSTVSRNGFQTNQPHPRYHEMDFKDDGIAPGAPP